MEVRAQVIVILSDRLILLALKSSRLREACSAAISNISAISSNQLRRMSLSPLCLYFVQLNLEGKEFVRSRDKYLVQVTSVRLYLWQRREISVAN